jgi:nucleoside-diphosphate-sugar epimerase
VTVAEETLTVAVTGPTGGIGRSLLAALDRSERIGRVLGMARRRFDPAAHGWTKVEYLRGNVLDMAAVERLVAEADVVVHLAFLIFGDRADTRQINLRGSRNVFAAAAAASAKRVIYTSSVAAYGFHADLPELVDETLEPQGTNGFYYSAQKAELEALLGEQLAGTQVAAYIFRPVVVGGPDALLLIDSIVRTFQVGGRLPIERALLRALPFVKPLLPDPGVPLQLVHHDDVAAALQAGIEGLGRPGVYNLAAPDPISLTEIAQSLGWRALPIPRQLVPIAAHTVERLERHLPQDLQWINAIRRPVLLDTTKARRELGWRPQHTSRSTLRETIIAARLAGILG